MTLKFYRFSDLLIVSLIFLFLSSYGQNLATSTFIGETLFAILIAILGLVLFSHLIGNMQVVRKALPLIIVIQITWSFEKVC